MTCSPSCWARYGDLLAAQYADPARMAFHQVVVDAYAAQHPHGADPRAIQSVGIHLMTLCLFLERDVDPVLGALLHRRMVNRPVFRQLKPPASRAGRTVIDVPLGADADTARAAAYAWAEHVWVAWATHHDVVRAWVDESAFGEPGGP